ncbi:MAG: hypothetical protein ACLSCV_06430 [Acutalibacteraceae bacterium]
MLITVKHLGVICRGWFIFRIYKPIMLDIIRVQALTAIAASTEKL